MDPVDKTCHHQHRLEGEEESARPEWTRGLMKFAFKYSHSFDKPGGVEEQQQHNNNDDDDVGDAQKRKKKLWQSRKVL